VRILTMMLNPYSEIVSVHAIQGVVVLLGGLGLIYALDLGLERWRAWPAMPIPEPPPRSGSSWLAPVARPRFILATSALAALCAASFGMPRWDSSALGEVAIQGLLGHEVEGLRRELRLEGDGAFFGKAGVSQAFHRRYRRDGDFVEVFVGHWNGARPDVSPFSPKMAYPGSGWAIEDEAETWLEPGPLRVETRQVRRWTSRRLVYHWNVGRGSLAAESLRSLLVLDRLPGWQRPGAFVVRLATNLDLEGAGRAAAEGRLRAFARAVREGLRPLAKAPSDPEKHSPISAFGFVGRPWRRPAPENNISFKSIG
jgi:EpsI family protein